MIIDGRSPSRTALKLKHHGQTFTPLPDRQNNQAGTALSICFNDAEAPFAGPSPWWGQDLQVVASGIRGFKRCGV